jgi:hypothetical protein
MTINTLQAIHKILLDHAEEARKAKERARQARDAGDITSFDYDEAFDEWREARAVLEAFEAHEW